VSFLLPFRGLFVAIGAALIVIGLLNIFGGGSGAWTFYGAFQIYWGVKEIGKFEKHGDASQGGRERTAVPGWCGKPQKGGRI
jgi:hypothetical protein